MIKFKSEAPDPYHITSRELAHILNKKHSNVLSKIKTLELDVKLNRYIDKNNRLRTEYYINLTDLVKICLSYDNISVEIYRSLLKDLFL